MSCIDITDIMTYLVNIGCFTIVFVVVTLGRYVSAYDGQWFEFCCGKYFGLVPRF